MSREHSPLPDGLFEAGFRTLFQHARIGIAVVDLRGRILESNRALQRILDRGAEEIARGVETFTHPDDLAADVALFGELVEGRRDHYRLEKRYLRGDGEVIWGDLHVSLVRDDGGRPRYAVALLEDVTERRRLEEERSLLLERVLAVVSHDLRNPLATILLNATSILEIEAPSPAWTRECVESIVLSAEQMNHLLKDLVDISRIEVGRLALESLPISADSLLRGAILMLQPLAAERRVRLEGQAKGDLPPVLADHDRILQVFSNLVGNALRATPEGGAVTLGAEALDGEVRFQVSDTGDGIAEEHIPRLFDHLRHPERNGGGSDRRSGGLGLAIARGIVEAHGGEIWAESTPGEGSTFFFTVPT